jgi:hypothetical protein
MSEGAPVKNSMHPDVYIVSCTLKVTPGLPLCNALLVIIIFAEQTEYMTQSIFLELSPS